MVGVVSAPWFGDGRTLPSDLWDVVCQKAGCHSIEERPCPAQWATQISHELLHVPETLVTASGVDHLFVASDLQQDADAHYGIAYEQPPRRRWIGLDCLLFENEAVDEDLRVPQLRAVLVEEIVHVWDFTLEGRASPFFSIDVNGVPGPEWRKVECDANGRPRAFAIPNRKLVATPQRQVEEDWASAVIWYLFRRDRLRLWEPERYAFVRKLFDHELHLR